ncbi:MAG TPA: hypothetical protein VKQ29_02150 [Aliidongia sp.]|nr:hypothetical protein [Aliidongia sp.]
MVGMKDIHGPMIVSFCFGGILLISLFVLCFLYKPTSEADGTAVALNLIVFVTGWATGWVAGTLVAPYDKDEAALFSKISKGIWAFLSGYLLAKVDPIFQSLHESRVIPLGEAALFRILLFSSVTIIVMLIVFFARNYANWHRDKDQKLGQAPPVVGAKHDKTRMMDVRKRWLASKRRAPGDRSA